MPTSNKDLSDILDFLHKAETLKKLYRHSWLSDGRQEDVASHTWRVSLMAIILSSKLDIKIDLEKVLKMIIVHDLGEIYAGDHHAFKGKLKNKHKLEKKALYKLTKKLPEDVKIEIRTLWDEFENCLTNEAKFANALDKIEVLIQHNESDLKYWEEREFSYNLIHGDEKAEFNKTIRDLKDMIREETKRKITRESNS